MSKPKTKGDLIPVRLPIAVDARVRESAKQQGVSPGVYLSRRIVSSLTPEPRPRAGLLAAPKPTKEVGIHVHDAESKSGAGVWRCKCGAVSTSRGQNWREV